MNLPTFLTKNYHCQYILVQVQASEQIVFDFFWGGDQDILQKKFYSIDHRPQAGRRNYFVFRNGEKNLGQVEAEIDARRSSTFNYFARRGLSDVKRKIIENFTTSSFHFFCWLQFSLKMSLDGYRERESKRESERRMQLAKEI